LNSEKERQIYKDVIPAHIGFSSWALPGLQE